jgi:hypothetical protein
MDEKSSILLARGCDDEELEDFFERLGRLVPKLRCSCDELSHCDYHGSQEMRVSNGDSNHVEAINEGYDSSSKCVPDQHAIFDSSRVDDNISPKSVGDCQESSQVYSLIPIQSLSFDHPTLNVVNNQFNPPCKSNRVNHPAVKTCRIRNRTTPYNLTKHVTKIDSRAKSSSSRCCPSTTCEPEGRLELLTDVIEYIHNLQSLLESAQGRGFDVSSDLDHGSKLHPEDQEESCKTTHSGKARYPFSDQDAKAEGMKLAHESDVVPPVDQAIKLLDRVVPAAGASSFRLVESVASVDRAIELLEYKTGAITLSA